MPPSLNSGPSGSQNTFFGTKVSIPGIDVNNAGDNQLIIKDNYDTRTYYNNGVPIILIGKLPDGSYGIQVSTPGVDVTTATSPQQFTLNSNFATIISPLNGTITIPGLPGQAGGTNGILAAPPIPHGLPYTPSIIAFAFGPVFVAPGPTIKYLNTPVPNTFLDANLSDFQITVGTDSTNIYAYNSWLTVNNDNIPAFPITYYLLNVTA